MVRSTGYGRARVVNGLLFAALGAVIVFRTIAAIGLTFSALPGLVLGLAMIGLGIVRLRAQAATISRSAPNARNRDRFGKAGPDQP